MSLFYPTEHTHAVCPLRNNMTIADTIWSNSLHSTWTITILNGKSHRVLRLPGHEWVSLLLLRRWDLLLRHWWLLAHCLLRIRDHRLGMNCWRLGWCRGQHRTRWNTDCRGCNCTICAISSTGYDNVGILIELNAFWLRKEAKQEENDVRTIQFSFCEQFESFPGQPNGISLLSNVEAAQRTQFRNECSPYLFHLLVIFYLQMNIIQNSLAHIFRFFTLETIHFA